MDGEHQCSVFTARNREVTGARPGVSGRGRRRRHPGRILRTPTCAASVAAGRRQHDFGSVPGVRGVIGRWLHGTPSPQAEAIRRATERSVRARNLYTEQVVAELTRALAEAEEQVRRAILHYKSLGSLPDNKLAALEGLRKLDAELREIMRTLRREQTLTFRRTAREAFRLGIRRGIDELALARMPFYRDLTPEGIDKLATRVFTLVDTDALDFMANHNLVLAGDVHLTYVTCSFLGRFS